MFPQFPLVKIGGGIKRLQVIGKDDIVPLRVRDLVKFVPTACGQSTLIFARDPTPGLL